MRALATWYSTDFFPWRLSHARWLRRATPFENSPPRSRLSTTLRDCLGAKRRVPRPRSIGGIGRAHASCIPDPASLSRALGVMHTHYALRHAKRTHAPLSPPSNFIFTLSKRLIFQFPQKLSRLGRMNRFYQGLEHLCSRNLNRRQSPHHGGAAAMLQQNTPRSPKTNFQT